jgi:hypothetical protein
VYEVGVGALVFVCSFVGVKVGSEVVDVTGSKVGKREGSEVMAIDGSDVSSEGAEVDVGKYEGSYDGSPVVVGALVGS